MVEKKKHDDTRISLDGVTIEEALKKAIDAGLLLRIRPAQKPSMPFVDATGFIPQRHES